MDGAVTPSQINYLANHPHILPEIAPGYAHVDIGHFLSRPGNRAFGNSFGAVLFVSLGGDAYELHYLFTPLLRGREALRIVRAALNYMFTTHGATFICGETPRENRAARAMNRALKARQAGEITDSLDRPCIVYVLERESWAASLAV